MTIDHAPAIAAAFDARGYAVVPGLMPRELMDIAFRYYLSYVGVPGYYRVEGEERALDRPADALGEVLLARALPQIEQRVGRRLLPTYSFARIYTTESRLSRHVDRGACEFSATVTVGFRNAREPWPICLEAGGSERAVALDIGDALVYRGMDVPHWRDPLPQGIWCQLFLHYVDADGALAHLRFDGRRALGPTPLVAAA